MCLCTGSYEFFSRCSRFTGSGNCHPLFAVDSFVWFGLLRCKTWFLSSSFDLGSVHTITFCSTLFNVYDGAHFNSIAFKFNHVLLRVWNALNSEDFIKNVSSVQLMRIKISFKKKKFQFQIERTLTHRFSSFPWNINTLETTNIVGTFNIYRISKCKIDKATATTPTELQWKKKNCSKPLIRVILFEFMQIFLFSFHCFCLPEAPVTL